MTHPTAVSRDARASVVIDLGYAAVPQGALGLRASQAELSQQQCLEKAETVTSDHTDGVAKISTQDTFKSNSAAGFDLWQAKPNYSQAGNFSGL